MQNVHKVCWLLIPFLWLHLESSVHVLHQILSDFVIINAIPASDLSPLLKVQVDLLLDVAHVESGPTDGDGGELDVRHRLRSVLQGRHHLLIIHSWQSEYSSSSLYI